MTTMALVGSESLLGREVRDIVATSAPGFDLRLIAADEERPGRLTRVGDEPSLIEVLGAMGIREVRRLRGEVGRAIFMEDIEREAFSDLVRK